ncbi:phage-related protein [Sphingomonas kyeonggiensis]|uniref:type II toxin-antitoxin system RelE/ParE family toxin n=1 Tax=Sphingomonas kyeonggiensis TaxID=1268553 RepID=UPI0027825837|nr:type II toxin-antitoxin system RelE/ParE family toxin [Sphingomonas kyeonggiensis]MDQ0248196.1 phage-related protein [Sphingomonas kyeonggiensis]
MKKVTFYQTANGNQLVADFIRSLPGNDRKVVGTDLMRLQIGYPMGPPLCKHIKGPIWELRSTVPSKREVRLLYFFDANSQQIIVVHAFIKTTRTTPKSDIDLADKRRSEF